MTKKNNSIKQRFLDNDNGTITDLFTGLMWQEGYAYRETGNYINWYNANDYIQKLNKQKLGSFCDWRLPNKLEIQSLYEIAHSFQSRGKTFILHIDPVLSLATGVVFGQAKPNFPRLLGLNSTLVIFIGILRLVCLEQSVQSGLVATHHY